jgi:DNA replication protein DnaC
MNDTVKTILENFITATPEPEDYTGEDGLLYCGKCHTPKQFRMDKPPMEGKLFPHRCKCEQERFEKQEAEYRLQKHLQTVYELKRQGFTDPEMKKWTFENDNGNCSQMENARFYVENWEDMRKENVGYLLWGKVGTGKSFFAGCIANALMEKEIPVRMTNFALILNDLSSFEGRNEYIERLCRPPLLIIDDFGMERGTEYGLEQVYNVIDSRYRSRKPLIVTTNLSLDTLQNPQDTAHTRIYDQLLEMCVPIRFAGESFRRQTAKEKLDRLKTMLSKQERLSAAAADNSDKGRSANDRSENE